MPLTKFHNENQQSAIAVHIPRKDLCVCKIHFHSIRFYISMKFEVYSFQDILRTDNKHNIYQRTTAQTLNITVNKGNSSQNIHEREMVLALRFP